MGDLIIDPPWIFCAENILKGMNFELQNNGIPENAPKSVNKGQKTCENQPSFCLQPKKG